MKNMFKILGVFVATLFIASVALAVNDVDIEQIKGDTNTSDTSQVGDDNDIDVKQEMSNGSTSTNEVDILQLGDNNLVDVFQDSNATSGSVKNDIDIEQDGGDKVRGASVTGNIASIDGATGSTGNQTGTTNNTLFVRQTAGSNDIGVDQTTLGGLNDANFVQSGTADHTVAVVQNTGSTTSGVSNTIDVDQTSDGVSDATNYQSGQVANSYTLNVHD